MSHPMRAVKFHNPQHSIYILERLQQMKLKRQFCDVQISIKGKKIYAHSAVLTASSDHFKSHLNENKTDVQELVFDDIDSTNMNMLVDYCYTGNIEICENNVKDLLNLAGSLQIVPIVRACCHFLEESIDIKNCLEITTLAKLFSCTILEHLGLDFARNHFKELVRSKDFVKLDCSHVISLIKCELDVSSELDVWLGVKKWLEYDRENRIEDLYLILTFIKLPLLPKKIITDEIRPLCGLEAQCERLIAEAIQWQNMSNKRVKIEPREPISTILAVGAWTDSSSSIVEIYNPSKKSWSKFADLKIDRRNYSVVRVDENLLLIGGFSVSAGIHNNVESFNLTSGEKKALQTMQVPRDHPLVAVLGKFLYAAGGSNHTGNLATVERYDLEKDVWTTVDSMSTGRSGCGVAVLNNEMYVVGGWTGAASSITEAFNPISGKWKLCASMNVKRMWPGVAAIGGHIYTIGGRQLNTHITEKFSSVERYDPVADKWTFVADISSPRYGVAGGALGGNIFAVGGANGVQVLTTVEEYDVDKNEWKITGPLNSSREISNIVSVPWKMIKNVKFCY
ncbi:kelch-like protein 26 [Arctopsyche grandis]|uniref:kelch-like protein 26 n=1 Tax=Arctopsyche grandis TaxID=121162 RepID=UPI00406D933C